MKEGIVKNVGQNFTFQIEWMSIYVLNVKQFWLKINGRIILDKVIERLGLLTDILIAMSRSFG